VWAALEEAPSSLLGLIQGAWLPAAAVPALLLAARRDGQAVHASAAQLASLARRHLQLPLQAVLDLEQPWPMHAPLASICHLPGGQADG
jgi:hypothetical protein